MSRGHVPSSLFSVLLAACVLLAGLTASPTVGAGGDAIAAKKKKKKKKKKYAPIRGKLSKRGYTVIALPYSGSATSVHVKGRRFRVRPTARRVTLHLRAPNGTYAGPIVVDGVPAKRTRGSKSRRRAKRGQKQRVIVGVKAGAKLGKVTLERRKGYAKVRRSLPAKWVDSKRWARARKGVPIGNGRNIGLVRSRHAHGPASDPDLDGVPSPLDVDDDGDLILDGYDRSTYKRRTSAAASKSVTGPTFPDGSTIATMTYLDPGEADATNVNGGSSDAQIAAAQREHGRIDISWWPLDADTGELDCGALVYCSAGGTGRLLIGMPTPDTRRTDLPSYPECCDPDGDGLGSLIRSLSGGPQRGPMTLYHGATADQIRAGDVLIERGALHGEPLESATSVGFVAATLPVLASYDDGQGDSATFAYPNSGAPGLARANPGGDVVLTLAFWRPQRPRIEGDPGAGPWIDVGNLAYATQVGLPEGGPPPAIFGTCPQSSYTNVDPNLTPVPPSPFAAGPPTMGEVRFGDRRGDQPSDPTNTFTYTLNVTDCLASRGASISAGNSFRLNFFGFALADNGAGGEKTETTLHSTIDFLLLP